MKMKTSLMKRLGTSLPTLGAAAVAFGILATPGTAHAALGFFQIPENPLAVGLDDVVKILVSIIQFGLMFAGAVAVLFVVVNGYQYILSAGNPEKVEKAKQGLTWSITGFILTVSSFAIVLLLQGILQASHRVNEAPGIVGILRGAPRDAQTIIPAIADALLVFGGSVAVLFIILNGYRYATSQGNQDQVQAARRGLLYSVIGLAVLFLAYTIVVTVTDALNG
jgi:type IV secretion system pilin